ncbi:hypothetical protein B7494_g7627 [Chlorociboria aeruginascens]|nr:hypothetical protein B7494_g7627 [Chlorociboria aeruginascens]
MSNNPTVQELLKRNQAISATHSPIPTLAELSDLGIDRPHLIVLTCIDPRCVPEKYLDLHFGEGVLVMRNAGGHVIPALNDILAMDAVFKINDIMVIHHTDCGTSHYTDDLVRADLKNRLPSNPEIGTMTFGAVTDIPQSVKDDLAILRASPYVREELKSHAYGFVFDLKTGKLSSVDY